MVRPRFRRIRSLLVGLVVVTLATASLPSGFALAGTPQASNALAHLRSVMDQATTFDVYADKYSVGNHFDPSGWMGDIEDISFDDASTATWHGGGNAIRISYSAAASRGNGWAGIYWQQPNGNWGTVPGVGFDLSGVTRATFWARGAVGGERAEFKVGGIDGGAPYPDSLRPAVSTGVLTLTTTWQQYAIDLTGRDLSYVIGGFAWVTSRFDNPGGATIYLDDVRFEGHTRKLRFLESYVSLTDFVPPRPMDTHKYLYVYLDADSTSNGFEVAPSRNGYFESGWMGDYGDISVDLGHTTNPHGGTTAFRATYTAAASQNQKWAGIYWQAPPYFWGDRPGGYDLTGAARLTVWARGAVGGERIEFLAGGVTGSFNDTLQPPRRTGVVTLTSSWQQYTIDLAGANLSRLGGGFGWVATQADNPAGATFYLDDVRYENVASPAGDAFPRPEFPPDSFALLTAHTYDNALALLAFLASDEPGDADRAKLLADSLVWAQGHDEIIDGRIRNVYYSDNLATGTTYGNNGRIARHNYDKFGNGVGTGNSAWALLALMNYYEKYGGSSYLSAAQGIGNWIVANTYSTTGAGGYTGGTQGWEPSPEVLTFKSTEHNIDLYVGFMQLYEGTADPVWRQRAIHAKNFVAAMWNDVSGFFYTGTRPDGITINTDVLPLDVNTWGFLALGEANKYGRGLTYARTNHYATETIGANVFEGLDFNTDKDGVWWEGTGQFVTALWAQYYFSTGPTQTFSFDNATKFRDELREAQAFAPRANGQAVVAANRDQLTTGFDLPSGGPFLYYNRRHIGATAWFVFSELQYNPFWGIPASQAIPYQGEYSSTGLRSPAAQAPNAGGDGNGYETAPASALGNDGLFAVDANSGTTTSTSCTDAGKDKHRFYNYGFSFPTGVAVTGIEIRLDAKVSNTGSLPKLCVQLSWNGGSSWTAAKSTPTLTAIETTYLLGSPSDTWGRSWTTTELSNTNLRVRVIDVASSTSRTFSLDWVAAGVTYE